MCQLCRAWLFSYPLMSAVQMISAHLWVPGEYLLQRHGCKAAALPARHVAGAHDLKRLDVDRAGEPCLQPTRAAGVVGAGPLLRRNSSAPLADGFEGRFGITD